MNKLFFIPVLLLLVCTVKAQQISGDEFDISGLEKKSFAAKQQLSTSSITNNYDLKYHRCEWYVDPNVEYIQGAITSYFVVSATNFNQLQFDLNNLLTVDSVKYHSTKLVFAQLSDDVLQITFPSAIALHTLDSVSVFYQGVPTATGFGSFCQGTHNGDPIVWTLSEPYGAKDWWPCKQILNDKIDSIDVIVTTPQAYRVASNGLLIAETQSGNNKTYHWKSTYPVAAYLIAIGVTNYVSYSDYVPTSNGTIEVLNYVYPENLSLAQTQTPDIVNIIKLYDSLTIIYPFANEKYGHAQFGANGGMEHQTMSFVNGFFHVLIAHECAHQWFGDHVTCGSWHDIWLNEGFATYFEGLTEERYSPEIWQGWKQDKLADITSETDGSVFCDDTTSVGRIFSGRLTYNKGAYLLHMLRWKLGDSLFFKSLKNYLNDPVLAHSYVRTSDLKAHLENTSGQNLTIFFNQWFYGQGYPSYHINWQQSANKVSFTLHQTTSHSSVSFFEMPVPILFTGPTKDTLVVFNHQSSGQEYTLTLDFPVISVQFDPELQLISANNSVTETINDVENNWVKIYPNPATNYINVLALNSANSIQQIELYDGLGKSIYKSELLQGLQKQVTIDLSTLPKGTYQLSILFKTGKKYKKFVKV